MQWLQKEVLNCENRKNDLILIMTPEKQDKTLDKELMRIGCIVGIKLNILEFCYVCCNLLIGVL